MLKEAKQYALPKDHAKVNDDKDHFNISDAAHGRNALARCNQYTSAPPWFNGTLKELMNTVYKNVHSKFPGIDIDPEKKKPGKQSSEENLSITKIAKLYEEELDEKKEEGDEVEKETSKKTPAQKAKKLKKKMKKMYKKAKKMLKKACKV